MQEFLMNMQMHIDIFPIHIQMERTMRKIREKTNMPSKQSSGGMVNYSHIKRPSVYLSTIGLRIDTIFNAHVHTAYSL